MGHRDPTYVIFDGDQDRWAYSYMRGWKANSHIDFDFYDAHDLTTMTSRASDENYVKSHLRQRMVKSEAVVVLVGESTKYLYKYVRWEIELALELNLPIVVVNLNNLRILDKDRCPPILRSACAIHIPFKLYAIQRSLDEWPNEFRSLSYGARSVGWRYYSADVYRRWGID